MSCVNVQLPPFPVPQIPSFLLGPFGFPPPLTVSGNLCCAFTIAIPSLFQIAITDQAVVIAINAYITAIFGSLTLFFDIQCPLNGATPADVIIPGTE